MLRMMLFHFRKGGRSPQETTTQKKRTRSDYHVWYIKDWTTTETVDPITHWTVVIDGRVSCCGFETKEDLMG